MIAHATIVGRGVNVRRGVNVGRGVNVRCGVNVGRGVGVGPTADPEKEAHMVRERTATLRCG
jgi:hypothetical protein